MKRAHSRANWPDPRLPETRIPVGWFVERGSSLNVDQLLFVDQDSMTYAFRGQAKLEEGSDLALQQGYCDGEECLIAIGRTKMHFDEVWARIERAEAAGLDVEHELLPAYLKSWNPLAGR